MEELLINFKNYVNRNIDDFLAHTSGMPQEIKKDELLSDHMNLTISYYQQLSIDKKVDQIVKGIINRLTIDGEPLAEEHKVFIYKLFVNAIYLHDTGKINPAFQVNALKNKAFTKRNLPDEHSIYSALIYIDIFTGEIKNIKCKLYRNYMFNILYSFAYSISRHHGSIYKIDKIDKLHKNTKKAIIGNNVDWRNNFNEDLHKAQENAKRGVLTFYNSESVYEIDFTEDGGYNPFIAENRFYDEWNMESTEFYILNKLLFSLIITCDYYSTYNYVGDVKVDGRYIKETREWQQKYESGEIFKKVQENKNSAISKDIQDLNMNELRTRIFIEAEKGIEKNLDNHIFYLEAPTGSGKTNTSINLMLKLLEANNNIKNAFYIFPFNTLVEQTADSLKEYFGKDVAVVNSITPIVVDEDDSGDKREVNFDASYLNRLFFHYPLSVTSHVNLFNALFGTTRENLYMLPRLCGSVIIMDEIQCYRNKIWREIVIMLQKYAELLNIKIIIMSATLPRLDYMLGENVTGFANLIENSKEFYENRAFKNRVSLNTDLLLIEDMKSDILADIVISKYKEKKGKCLIEFIKKKTAREFYNELKNRINELEIEKNQLFELTGDDNNFIRKTNIARIKNLENVIVVSTQVIEAGVDIDMDYGFKNISLIDSEEQFLGRINRGCSKPNCMVSFFMIDEPKDIYEKDNRIQFTLKDPDMLEYLALKDFHSYYQNVMNIIMDKTSKQNTSNIEAFKVMLLNLEYGKVNAHMKLIDNRNVQIFLGYEAEVDSDGKKETIDGRQIWQEYKELCLDKNLKYAQRQVKLSQLGEKMSYFTYNVSLQQAEAFHDEKLGFYYIEHGEDFIEDGKFMRDKFTEKKDGLFI